MATKEAGQRPQRAHFIRESEPGVPGADPDMKLFSSNVINSEFTPDAGITAQRGIGSADPKEHRPTVEDSSGSIEYHQYRPLVTTHFQDPNSTTTLGVKSTDSADTGLDVTIYNDDESKSETITTDGTDATTFVNGSTSFDTIGRVTVSGSHAGEIEVYVDDSGSPGTKLGGLESGTTDQEDKTPNDAAYDAILRNKNEDLANTHALVQREEHHGEGVNGTGRRMYSVALGGRSNAEMTGDATDDEGANYITIALDYEFEKVRSFLIHQPASGGEQLELVSTSSDDTSQYVIIESEDRNTTETIQLNGTTTVTTTSSFEDIDAVYIVDSDTSPSPTDTQGDITVTGATSGNTLTTLFGRGSYDESEGDSGIPAVGSGSIEDSLTNSAALFLGSDFEWPPGSGGIPERVASFTLSIENSIDKTPDATSRRQSVDAGDRTPQMTGTLYGEKMTHRRFVDHFTSKTNDFQWTTSKEELTLVNATINDPGSRASETGNAIRQNDVQFEGTGLTANELP